MLKPLLFLLMLILSSISGSSQVITFYKEGLDTLKMRQFTGNLYLGFYFSQDALQYLYLSATAAGLYVDSRNTYEISGVITYKGLEQRSTGNNGYAIFRANLWRHLFVDDTIKTNRINAQPFVMFQFDENRGIYNRWQVGFYAVPTILMKKKVEITAGVGMLYQFDRYDLLPPDYVDWWNADEMKKIYHAIHQLDPDSAGFVNRAAPRAAMYLSVIASFGKNVNMNVLFSYQQPFSSTFKGTPLYSISADYRTPYPCITVESLLNFNILKWLSLNIRYYMQHDRNQLTYYLPYYVYSITMGVTFAI
ncbi:MAG: hypothetical protein NT004_05585 [Bacteroidetes bacterium]|nr:hypothetical protein [Bacteroidota bacterium]